MKTDIELYSDDYALFRVQRAQLASMDITQLEVAIANVIDFPRSKEHRLALELVEQRIISNLVNGACAVAKLQTLEDT